MYYVSIVSWRSTTQKLIVLHYHCPLPCSDYKLTVQTPFFHYISTVCWPRINGIVTAYYHAMTINWKDKHHFPLQFNFPLTTHKLHYHCPLPCNDYKLTIQTPFFSLHFNCPLTTYKLHCHCPLPCNDYKLKRQTQFFTTFQLSDG